MLVKTDRASMAHSLEARVPILDTVVAELALSLPSRLNVRGFSKKRLVRRAMEPLLPRAVLHGPKKGFAIPIAAWLRGELEPFAREALSPEVFRRQGFFRPDAGTALLDAHLARRDDYSRQLWALLNRGQAVNGAGGVTGADIKAQLSTVASHGSACAVHDGNIFGLKHKKPIGEL